MQGFFHRLQVGQTQLGLDHLDVGDRVHLARYVDHVLVFKAAHHVHDGIGLADVCQKFVAQAFAGAGTRHQTGNIDKLDDCALDFLRFDDGRERCQPGVGHFDNANVGLNRAKGIVFGRNTGFGQGVEQGRFTDVGQAHDATFHISFTTHKIGVKCIRCPPSTIGSHDSSF